MNACIRERLTVKIYLADTPHRKNASFFGWLWTIITILYKISHFFSIIKLLKNDTSLFVLFFLIFFVLFFYYFHRATLRLLEFVQSGVCSWYEELKKYCETGVCLWHKTEQKIVKPKYVSGIKVRSNCEFLP